MSKNFSCNNLGQRKKSDFYETPYSITEQFLNEWKINKSLKILEPACGNGAIVSVLKNKGFENIIFYDKDKDFLKEKRVFDYLITNPPFSLSFEFIIKAKQIIRREFSLLLPLSYLHGVKRYEEIYSNKNFPLKEIFVFTRYPMLGEKIRKDGKYKTGMMVYAWFVFSRNYLGKPLINWINNQEFVLKKGD